MQHVAARQNRLFSSISNSAARALFVLVQLIRCIHWALPIIQFDKLRKAKRKRFDFGDIDSIFYEDFVARYGENRSVIRRERGEEDAFGR